MVERVDEAPSDRERLMRQEYHGQTARIHWHELQTYFASGSVIMVAPELSLVEVAVQLGMDNTTTFQQWIDSEDVGAVDDEQARTWYEANTELWAVVAAPWVLVQQREDH
ncbi:MAG: DUF2288 domain-containing protein [Halioglobus sp.]|nr:DUF2288 domain-containing protein [Halioglobus sp.]